MTGDARPQCSATVGWEAGEYAPKPIRCGQTVGVIRIPGTDEVFCSKPWHREQVIARVERTKVPA